MAYHIDQNSRSSTPLPTAYETGPHSRKTRAIARKITELFKRHHGVQKEDGWMERMDEERGMSGRQVGTARLEFK